MFIFWASDVIVGCGGRDVHFTTNKESVYASVDVFIICTWACEFHILKYK